MGAIAIRATFGHDEDTPSTQFYEQLFALMPAAITDSGLRDDIRVAVRFHARGVDVDLSSDHPGGANDTSITRLASTLNSFLRDNGLHSRITILRAGEHYNLTPIATLPVPT